MVANGSKILFLKKKMQWEREVEKIKAKLERNKCEINAK